VVVGVLAIWIYNRELSWTALGRAIRTFRPSREMIFFALPQNLNRTLERFITNIDVVMLGLFGYSAAAVGLYGAGSLIVREIRHVKLVFSSSFAPHIVQLYFGRHHTELSRAFSQTTRWITTWSIPLLIAVALLRNDLLQVVHPDFGGEDTAFMLVLLVIPYLQSSVGLAGNIVVMTGHSGLNLFNSVTAAVLNILLNLWWIPVLGPVGAALASAVAALAIATLSTSQMVFVVRARPLVREMIGPHLAGIAGLVVIGAVAVFAGYMDQHLFGRLAILATSLAVYYGTLQALRAAGLGLSKRPA
jgi:O-antigen/teichoic acid export membrane protein